MARARPHRDWFGPIALGSGIVGCLAVLLVAARPQTGQAYVRIENPSRAKDQASSLLRVEPNRGTEHQILKLGPLRFRRLGDDLNFDSDPGPFYLDETSRKATLFRPAWPRLDRGANVPLGSLAAPLKIDQPARLIAIVGHPNQAALPSLAAPKPADPKAASAPAPVPTPAPTAPAASPSKLLGDSEPAEPVTRIIRLGTGDRLRLSRFGDAVRMDVGWLIVIHDQIKMVSPEDAWAKIGNIAFLVTIGEPGVSPPSGPEWHQDNLGIAFHDDDAGNLDSQSFGLVVPMIAVNENCDDIKITVKIGRRGAVRTLGPTRPLDLGVKIGTLLSDLSWRRISEEKGSRGQVGLEAGDLVYLRAPDLGAELQEADFVEVAPVLRNSLPLRFQVVRK